MTFGILIDALKPVFSNDPTIDSNLAITTGKVTDCFVGNLHDVVRTCCAEIEKARVQILITTSYWEGRSLSAFMLSQSLRRTVRNHRNVKVRILVDNGRKENIGKKGNIRIIEKEKWKKELGL